MKNQTEACEDPQEGADGERWVFLISLVILDDKFTIISRVISCRLTLKGWRCLRHLLTGKR